MSSCTHCGAELDSVLCCRACGALQEAPASPSPFAVFGLEPTYAVDREQLRRRLLELQRATHPDFHGGAGDARRELAERNTAELNGAFDVLADDFRRADHLIRGLGGPDEKAERQMPAPFLMEVMEWNEVLEEARGAAGTPGPPGDAVARALDLGKVLERERARLLDSVARHLSPLPSEGATALTEVRKELNAIRYVDRALRELEEIRLEQASSN